MLDQIGDPGGLVGIVVCLALEESSFMAGAQIVTDGGETTP
jgi:hypothetical protein